MKTIRNKSGLRFYSFTLLEVLAALFLMAVVLPVAMRGVTIATQVASVSLKRRQLTELARNRMAEIIATQEWSSGDAKGEFEDYSGYYWEMEVSDWDDDSIKEIDLNVYKEDNEDLKITLSRLVYEESSDDE